MDQEKAIKKLVKRAEERNCIIEEEKLIDVSLDEFLGINGELYYDKNKSSLYKALGGKCFRYKIKIINEEEKEIKATSKNEDERINEIYQWGNNFKKYVDSNIIKLNEDIKKNLENNEQKNRILLIDIQSINGKIKELSDKLIKIESNQEDLAKSLKEYVDLNVKSIKEDFSKVEKKKEEKKSSSKKEEKNGKKITESEKEET